MMHALCADLRNRLVLMMLGIGLSACSGGAGIAASPAAPAMPSALTVDVSPVAKADPGSVLPEGWEYGGIMEIFVRSYQDSDGDGHGDLRGLISRLDYLHDLGVKGLWLMPVHPSQDHDHGYAVTDYRAIEPQYGSMADFDELIRQAHARGIGIILDVVMNHSAAQHPLFQLAYTSPTSPYRNWYLWQDPAPTDWRIYGSNPWRATPTGAYFAGFSDTMPDFNLTLPAVVTYHQDNLRFWLNRGVDGFRFDAVGNLVENGPNAWEKQPQDYILMGQMRSLVQGYTRRTLVCEGPADSRGFAADGACGSAFAFDLNRALIQAARGSAPAIQTVSDYFRTAPANMATFLSNHDAFAGDRVFTQVGGKLEQARLAAAALLLLPGRPYLYYGEEVGMANAATVFDDGKLRTPMSWSADTTRAGFTTGTPYRALSGNVASNNAAAAQADPNGLLPHYQALLALRNARPSIARGTYEAPFVSGSVMGFQRVLGAERTLVLINFGSADVALDVAALPAGAALQALLPVAAPGGTASAAGVARLSVPAQGQRVYLVGG
jgi:glycosidase